MLKFVNSPAAQESAHLSLFAERNHIRLDVVLMPPHPPCQADARLHFINDQHRIVFIGKFAKCDEELLTKLIVATLTLNRFDDDRCNVIAVINECLFDLLDSEIFFQPHLREILFVEGKTDRRIVNPGPFEFRKERRFYRISVGE